MCEYLSREAVFQVIHGIARGIADRDIEALKAKDIKALYKAKGAKEILDSVATDLCYIPAADVQPVSQWISVKERQPDKDDLYLVAVENEICVYIDIADYSNNQWHKHDEVIYWQPLPELPKEG